MPNCSYWFTSLTIKYCVCPPEINRSRYGNSILFSKPGLKAWPSKWFTPINGLLENAAIDFPMLSPTVRQTINPGPAVAATPSVASPKPSVASST